MEKALTKLIAINLLFLQKERDEFVMALLKVQEPGIIVKQAANAHLN